MKLIYKIALSLSAVLLVFIALWGIIFFNVMTAEINDETDDMLEEYSRDIIMRWLSGERLLSTDNGTNNTYYIKRITAGCGEESEWINYEDSDIYIANESEHEPARIRRQIFMDADGSYYELTVAVPTFEREDLRRSILWSICMLYLVLLVALVAITMAIVIVNMRPFNALLRWFDSYRPGRENPPVPADTDVIEFRKLADAAESATARFERQYRLQNQFIGNASHELQTPLAVCSARIEMLLDSQDLTQSQAEELVKMQSEVSNLIRLNKTLLMMSRIENGQFLATEEVNVGMLLREDAEMFGEIYADKCMKMEIIEESMCVWTMNPELASVLSRNLLKNAFLHSPSHTAITVRYGKDSFTVSNDGEKSLDAGRVFTRFYQENPGRTGSTGLGLSLVKAICDDSELTVVYYYDGRHNFKISVN